MSSHESGDVSWIPRGGHRPFWIGVGIALGAMALVQGANYVATGNSRVTSPNLYVLTHNVPGGMRTYGYVLLTVGAILLYHLKSDTHARRRAVMLFCALALFVAFMQFSSLLVGVPASKFNFAGPATWLSFAAISGLMIVFPPPPKGSDDV